MEIDDDSEAKNRVGDKDFNCKVLLFRHLWGHFLKTFTFITY